MKTWQLIFFIFLESKSFCFIAKTKCTKSCLSNCGQTTSSATDLPSCESTSGGLTASQKKYEAPNNSKLSHDSCKALRKFLICLYIFLVSINQAQPTCHSQSPSEFSLPSLSRLQHSGWKGVLCYR